MQQSQQPQPALLFTIRFHNHRPQLTTNPNLTHSNSTNSLTHIQPTSSHSLTHPPVLLSNNHHPPLLYSHTHKELTLPDRLAKVAS